jgi:glycosyltransferase involved in cell wall biosynthesis
MSIACSLTTDEYSHIAFQRISTDTRTLLAIVPVFNEEKGLRAFHASLWKQEEVISAYGWQLAVLYVDDGSTDNTPEILAQFSRCNNRVRILRLTRNFGHQAALCAGLDAARADAIVILDGDGQHPVDLIPEMLRLHLHGTDIVRVVRLDDKNAGSAVKRWFSRSFHHLWQHLSAVDVPAGMTEFALFGLPVLQALQQFHEVHRYLRGLLSLVGFTTKTLSIPMRSRQHGSSKFSLRKQVGLASDGLFSFSTLPLRLGLLPGCVFIAVACVESLAALWRIVMGYPLTPGWTSLMILVTLGFGCTIVLLTIIGIYIGKIFEQVKNRPIYFMRPDTRLDDRVAMPNAVSPTLTQEQSAPCHATYAVYQLE